MEIEHDGIMYEVNHMPKQYSDMKKDIFYIVGCYVYRYIGEVDRMLAIPRGCIAKVHDTYRISEYSSDVIEKYSIENINYYNDEQSVDDIIDEYFINFINDNNAVKDLKKKVSVSGELYIPDLKEHDDALTRILKLMIIHKGIVRNSYKSNNSVLDTNYEIDNMISALNGATRNTTITRFLLWCQILELDWEFTIENISPSQSPKLSKLLKIGSKIALSREIGDTSNKSIFKVPLNDEDDPLKRLIKVALIDMEVNLNKLASKGSTPHLINNMRSALKGKSKMSMLYFMSWCEILGLHYTFKLIDPVDGTSYQADANYSAEYYQ